jgi:hypothetical protein
MAKLSRTAKFYRENPEARKKHNETQKKINKKPSESKKRVELNKANKKMGKVGDGKDVSHTKNGLKLKPQSVNRGSNKDQAGDRRARGKKK